MAGGLGAGSDVFVGGYGYLGFPKAPLWHPRRHWRLATLRFESPVQICGNKKSRHASVPARLIVAESWGFAALPAATLLGFALRAQPATGRWPVAPSRVRIPSADLWQQKSRYVSVPARLIMAESWGFEPQIGSLLYSLSRRAPSASRSALQYAVLRNHTPKGARSTIVS